MTIIKKPTAFASLPVIKELDDAVNAIFLKSPDLSFEAHKKREYGPDQEDHIFSVVVYAGNQRLGTLGWERRYMPSQGMHISTYAIKSPRIRKSRGSSRDTKYTKDLKSAVNVAKEVFVPATKSAVAFSITNAFRGAFRSIAYTGARGYTQYAADYGKEAFSYVVELLGGGNPQMPPKLIAEINSERFKAAHDTYRILQSLEDQFDAVKSGVVVKIERDETISVANVCDNTMMMEAKSTYDLPKNYQEKLTILKVMDMNTPIEHVGIKLEAETNEQNCTLYYLVGGDTVVTH